MLGGGPGTPSSTGSSPAADPLIRIHESGDPRMADYKYITYETLDDGLIARIMLNRVDARNAQNRGLLVELDDAFLRAEADDTVSVVIFGGNGQLFSSGHDIGTALSREEAMPG